MLQPGDLIIINERVIGELRLVHNNGDIVVKVAAMDSHYFQRGRRVGIITTSHPKRHCYCLSMMHYEIRNLCDDDFDLTSF